MRKGGVARGRLAGGLSAPGFPCTRFAWVVSSGRGVVVPVFLGLCVHPLSGCLSAPYHFRFNLWPISGWPVFVARPWCCSAVPRRCAPDGNFHQGVFRAGAGGAGSDADMKDGPGVISTAAGWPGARGRCWSSNGHRSSMHWPLLLRSFHLRKVSPMVRAAISLASTHEDAKRGLRTA